MKSISVKKIDSTNGAPPEVAIRVDSGVPGAPVDTQIWFDKTSGELAIQANGVKNTIRPRVLPIDPISPVDGEVWINSTTFELKFKSGGSVHTAGSVSAGGSQTSPGDYAFVLSEAELGLLLPLSYPNYIIDAFNAANDEAVNTNVSPQASALRLNGSNLTGQSKYQLESSTYADMAEGIAVVTPNSFKPLTYVDNLDGTSTMTFTGDITGFFADLKKVLMYKEITAGGGVRSIYVTGGDNKLAIINVIGAPVFALGVTTIVINNSPAINGGGHIDILTQLGVAATALRMYPLDLTMKAGGAGSLGSQDTIYPSDAHAMDQLRSLGGDVFTQITQDIQSNINKIAIQSSPNRQYWIIGVAQTLPADNMQFVFYFSVDSLATLQKMSGSIPIQGSAFLYDQLNADALDGVFTNKNMKISNSGKFLIVTPTVAPFSGAWRPRLAFGNLTDPTPTPVAAPSYNESPGCVQPSNPGNNYTFECMAMDADDDWVCYTMCNQSNHISNSVFYKDAGATFVGVSDATFYSYLNTAQDIAFYSNLEGEKQVCWVGQAVSPGGYPEWRKKRISTLPVPFSGTRTDYALQGMFSNEAISQPETAEGVSFLIANSFDSDKIRSWWWSDSNERSFYTEVHLEDVIPGTNAIQHISFSSIPTTGQWDLKFGANTTSPAFSATETSSVIQTRLRALGSIGGPYVNVTGNYTSGFDVEFVGYPTGLGKAPQGLLVNITDTLFDVGSNPVNINIVTSQPGVAPIFPHYLSQFRHNFAGVGDKVRIMGNRQDADYDFWEGMVVPGADFKGYIDKRVKKHPSNTNQAFMVWEKFNNLDNYVKIDGLFLQYDHLDTMQGMFLDNNNGVPAASAISGTTSANNGDELATKITWDRNITVKCLAIQGGFDYNNYAASLPKSRNLSVRAKLVADNAGSPNEGVLVELSPTKFCLDDVWTAAQHWMEFRFNTPVTNGLVQHLVVYVENLSQPVATDWPSGTAGQEFIWWGASSGGNSFYKQAGVWVAGSQNLNYRAYDFSVEQVKAPDLFQYGKFDLTSPQGVTNLTNYNTICELQLEYNTAQDKLLMSWIFRGMVWQDIGLYLNESTMAYRTFDVPVADTFVTDQNVGTKTKFLGYDPSTYDHNLIFHARLSDPQYQATDRFGQPKFVNNDPNLPQLSMDMAGGLWQNWHGSLHFTKNNSNYGHTADSRFKSGWATKFNTQGDLLWYAGLYGNTRANNWTIETEIVPTAADIVGYSGGLSIIFAWGGGNGFYLGLQSGAPQMVIQNNLGPGFTGGNTTRATNVLTAGQYYGLRVTRSDDQLIRLYFRTSKVGTWVECGYSTQSSCDFKYTYPNNGYYFAGRYIDGSSYRWDGMIGEIKVGYGAATPLVNSFLNGDGIADQRPMYEHQNIGDRVLAKKRLSGGVNNGSNDDERIVETIAGFASPAATTAKVAAHDQLLRYRDLTIPQGKKLAATLQLDRVTTQDNPAVQGFLMNYEKQ